MAESLGMSPERVVEITRALEENAERLSEVSLTVQRAAVASINPPSFGLQSGASLLAPWSIVSTQVAAARVRDAASSARALTARLHAETGNSLAVSGQAEDPTDTP